MGTGKILTIVGGQWGSESKGCVVSNLMDIEKVDVAVRTGAINAGHTLYYKNKPYVNQQLPVGWCKADATLVLGAGAYIHPATLEREIGMINEATGQDVRKRLFIDKRCGLHTDEHHKREEGLHQRMGSTGEGVGAALVDKLERRRDYLMFRDHPLAKQLQLVDTVELLNRRYNAGQCIMLEGTQGTQLDLHLGDYPFVTSRQTHASAWAAEAGLSPSLNHKVVMVFRTHPIRVAGNSGPMRYEITWPSLARAINQKLSDNSKPPLIQPWAIGEFEAAELTIAKSLGLPDADPRLWTQEQRWQYSSELSRLHADVLAALPEVTVAELRKLFEITTVTKKLRRVGSLDLVQLKEAAVINRPAYAVMTFLNYEFPTRWGINNMYDLYNGSEGYHVREYLQKVGSYIDVPIKYVNTSPTTFIPTNL